MSLQQVFTRPLGLGARIRTGVMYAHVCGKGGFFEYESQRRHYNELLSFAE